MKDFQELVQRLSLALKSLTMYTGAHPRARAAVAGATEYLQAWLADAPSVHLAASNGRMFLDGQPFEGQSVHMAGFARLLTERQISGLILTRGLTEEELERTLGLLILKPSRIEEKGGALRAMAELGLTHVEIGQVQYREVREGELEEAEHAPAIKPVTIGLGAAPLGAEARTGAGAPQPSMDALRTLVDHWRQAFRNVLESGPRPADRAGADAPFRASTGIALDVAGGGGSGRFPAPTGTEGPGGTGPGPLEGSGWGSDGSGSAGPGAGGSAAGDAGLGGPGLGGPGAGGPGLGGSGLGGPGLGGPGAGGPGAGEGGEGSGGWGATAPEPLPDARIEGLPPQPADLSVLGATLAGAGIGEGFPEPQALDALRKAMHELPAGVLLSVVEGMDTLPRSPGGLRLAFSALSPEAFARATASLLARGAGQDQRWPNLRDRLHGILHDGAAGPAASLLGALEQELRSRGLGLENIRELVALLEWDNMTVDDQVRALETRGNLWALTHHQRLAFLRRLLDEGRVTTYRQVQAQVIQGLEAPDVHRREAAARTLAGVANWLGVPGLPHEAEEDLVQGLGGHFLRESSLQVHKATVEALGITMWELIARGEPGRAHTLVDALARPLAGGGDPMRLEALAWLKARLGQPEALARVFELLHTANPETLLTELIPYLEAVGAPAARALVAVLGVEEDRKRRVRLVEVIRGLGHLALPAMHEALESDKWFLVRNTLNILTDLGDASALRPAEACLSHPDGRVRRAAVRTVWKLGGANAVPALLAAFGQADAETLLEIMFAFGQIRAATAIPLLGQFALDGRMPEKLRARAAETLGLIGEPKAQAVLEDLLRRKGRIFTTAEPTEVRLGAAKGLLSLGTPQALGALRAFVEREPRSADRPLLQQVLEQARP